MRIDALLASCGLPRSEALRLLAHASGWSRERLIAGSHEGLPTSCGDGFAALARRRAAGEPLAYLVGEREFFGRPFVVDPNVLIPRHETELLVEHALVAIDAVVATADQGRHVRVLDLGTGSGVIAITLSIERPGTEVVATDASDAALDVARLNATRLAAPILFASSDWFENLANDTKRFDLIVANPPYIAAHDEHLGQGDLRFEPIDALTDHADGLAGLRRIIATSPSWLVPGGMVAVEHGHDQAASVRAMFEAAGYEDIVSARDLAGIERVTSGTSASSRL